MCFTFNSRLYLIYIRSVVTRNFKSKKINFFPLVLFCLGFSTVFVILGASASFLGKAFLQNSDVLRVVAGIIIIVFSLQLIGVINIPYLNFEKRFDAKESRNILFPYVIGLAFGFGWTPCIGPILGSILALASIEETLSRAIILLICYSLGLTIPFVLSGYLIQKFLLFSKNFKRNINLISKIGGITLLVTGILILTNQLQAIGFYIIEIFPFMQKFG